ncbi:hypothetical protein QBC34DRAFT_497213 [Podospora aff. communis PSN243]|uniref:SKP1 component dimerisation domain-containing protein n=1 Tax=Podospora aff. communis PSN243 TaxID=3040156 RepID=A0AAV9GF51_9PEZI|nr:hypothetical protein QBC34DRAFT_497213 [Podospora aff. communis PSN243]
MATTIPMLQLINTVSPSETIHNLSKPAAMQSDVLRDLLTDVFDMNADIITEPIPIWIHASDEALIRALAWMERGALPLEERPKCLGRDGSNQPIEQISEPSLLFELANVANYLSVEKLLDEVVARIARLLSGKTVEEMRAFCGYEDDLTQEEKDEMEIEAGFAKKIVQFCRDALFVIPLGLAASHKIMDSHSPGTRGPLRGSSSPKSAPFEAFPLPYTPQPSHF